LGRSVQLNVKYIQIISAAGSVNPASKNSSRFAYSSSCIELINVKTGQPVPKVETCAHPRFQVPDKKFEIMRSQVSIRPTGSNLFQLMEVTKFSMSPAGWSMECEPVEALNQGEL
jgi:hypothetical protein